MLNKEKVREVLEQFWTIAREYCSLKSKALPMDAAIDHAIAALESLLEQEQDGWIPVSDRLPEEDGSYLVYPEGKYYDCLVEFTVKGFTFDGDTVPPMSFYYTKDDSHGYTYSFKIEPKMWHSLPALPKTEAGE